MSFLQLANTQQGLGQDASWAGAEYFGGAEQIEGTNAFYMDESSLGQVAEASRASMSGMGAMGDRADSIYGSNGLTRYDPDPVVQRDPAMVAELAFPTDPKTKDFWGKTSRLLNLSRFGQADFISRSEDFKLVSFKGFEYESHFATIGIGWKMKYEDYKQQKENFYNFNEQQEKVRACRLAMNQLAEMLAFRGNSARQILGIANNHFIPRMPSPIKFDGSTDPGEQKQVFAAAKRYNRIRTQGSAKLPNALVGSMEALGYLADRDYSTTRETSTTTLQAMLRGSGIPKGNVFEAPYFDQVGPDGSNAMFFYRRDRDCISWHRPVNFQFLPIFKKDGYETIQLCIGRIGSLWSKYPEDCLLLTGI